MESYLGVCVCVCVDVCVAFFEIFSLNLLQYWFHFMFWCFGHKACGILAPRPGLKPATPALESKVVISGPPEKSLDSYFGSTHF